MKTLACFLLNYVSVLNLHKIWERYLKFWAYFKDFVRFSTSENQRDIIEVLGLFESFLGF